MRFVTVAAVLAVALPGLAEAQALSTDATGPERNKQIARAFYQDLWFSRNTDRYAMYVAPTYVVHDTGDRKGVSEPAIEQKHIADFFWENGDLSGVIDFQIAEGDLVATRWRASMQPRTLMGRVLLGGGQLPIINVFRIQDGKIVEIWNHRHDIDTGQTLRYTLRGLGFGLVLALIPTGYALALRRRLRRAASAA